MRFSLFVTRNSSVCGRPTENGLQVDLNSGLCSSSILACGLPSYNRLIQHCYNSRNIIIIITILFPSPLGCSLAKMKQWIICLHLIILPASFLCHITFFHYIHEWSLWFFFQRHCVQTTHLTISNLPLYSCCYSSVQNHSSSLESVPPALLNLLTAHLSSFLLIHVLHHPHFPSTFTCSITVSLFKCHHLLSLDLQRHSEAPSDLYYQHSQKETLHPKIQSTTLRYVGQ